MFKLIKQVFIKLLSFCGSLATVYVPLKYELYMIRPNRIELNHIELIYYPFMRL